MTSIMSTTALCLAGEALVDLSRRLWALLFGLQSLSKGFSTCWATWMTPFPLMSKAMLCVPYHCYYLTKQAKLLEFWDEIGLPHEKPKQEYGRQLKITGIVIHRMRCRLQWTTRPRQSYLKELPTSLVLHHVVLRDHCASFSS
jgi:hypothetical protein